MDKDHRILEAASGLAETLSRISDLRQRAYALAIKLKDEDNSFVIKLLRVVREMALLGHEDFLRIYNCLILPDTLAEGLGESKVSELAETAQTEGVYEVVAFFLDIPGEISRELPFQPFLDGTLKETPLGMRKALARKPDFKLIKRIARDQDPRVIKVLLDNPRLTEMDVVRIAATRPTSPQVLEQVSRHPRWGTRYLVKKVVVFNPYSPVSLSLRLLTFMTLQDLEDIVNSPDLSPLLQREAERIVEKKARPLISR